MTNSTRLRLALCATAVLGVAACSNQVTTSPTGKPVVTAATVGTDLIAVGSTVHLAATYVAAQPGTSPKVVANLNTASTGITATGNSLRTSTASTGDARENIALAETALSALADGYASTSPAAAARVAEFKAVLAEAVALYNADAAMTGMPQVTVAGL